MRICILCENKNIEAARLNSKNIFPAEKTNTDLPDRFKDGLPKTHLHIPCSPTGEGEPTHWFCFMSTDNATYERIVNNSLYSEVEESSPKEFLQKWGVKVIR